MSRFKKLSQTLWHCQSHIVWIPKYRYKVLTCDIAREAEYCIRGFSGPLGGNVTELNLAASGGKASQSFFRDNQCRPLWGRNFTFHTIPLYDNFKEVP